MSDNEFLEEENLPLEQLILKKHKGISPIWILPFIALLIGGWLVYKTYTDDAIAITIEFETGDGIEIDKTEIVYKGITVGLVADMVPKEDLTGVIVTADMERTAATVLNAQTKFWLVQPRISLRGVSGIGTLLSGNYISIQPSFSGRSTRKFVALIDPPPISDESPGLHLTFTSDELDSISEGSEILFRKIPIGMVQSYNLREDEKGVEIKVHIEKEYEHLIKKGTRFWNASGISVKGNLSGIKVRTESLSSVLLGGIAFTNPENAGEELAEDGDVYELYSDFDTAEVGISGTIHFANAEGLSEEVTKIVYQGVQVGLVREIDLADNLDGVDAKVIFNPLIENMLVEGTRFWKVGAEFSLKGVSHLETLLFGNYITLKPGKGNPTTTFSAVDKTPPMDASTPGLHLTLKSPVLGSLSSGSEIFYRKIPIGRVKNYEFAKGSGEVLIHIFIEAKAAKYINSETKFFNASGVKIEASLPKKGIKIQTESLGSVISGGISVITDVDSGLPKAKNRDKYRLFADFDAANEKGMMITLEFPSAEGLAPGADLRYQSIKIGEVKSVKWFDDLKKVKVEALLYPEGESVAKSGSLFWVATSEIGFRMKNVDTLLFGGFVQVKPGEGELQTHFEGLDYMPNGSYARITSGVNVKLKAERAETIIRNDPVFYREMIVGKVTGFELSPDSKDVYILANIREAYAPLIRENTVFWNVSGVRCSFHFSFRLFDCMVKPLESLFAGGLSFATPPLKDAGNIVEDGHVFVMNWEEDKDWMKWNPGMKVIEGQDWTPATSSK